MKNEERFFTSLERYLRKVVTRSPLPHYWAWVMIGGALMVMGTSIAAQNGIVGARNMEEAIRIAAGQGDYEMARKLLDRCQMSDFRFQVLGASTEIEDLVYPERKVERMIAELTDGLSKYPENKDIYKQIAQLYYQLGNDELAREFSEKARVLDPNGK